MDGDPITTLIVNEKTEAPPRTEQERPLQDNQKIALDCLDKALKASGTTATVGEDFEERKVTTVSEWKKWFEQEGKPGDSSDTKRKAFDRARDALIAKGKVAAQCDLVFRTRP
jgi:hypothetical protein